MTFGSCIISLKGTSAGFYVRSPAEAFAKGGDSDELDCPCHRLRAYNTCGGIYQPLKKVIDTA
jgi:hypothetical protein